MVKRDHLEELQEYPIVLLHARLSCGGALIWSSLYLVHCGFLCRVFLLGYTLRNRSRANERLCIMSFLWAMLVALLKTVWMKALDITPFQRLKTFDVLLTLKNLMQVIVGFVHDSHSQLGRVRRSDVRFSPGIPISLSLSFRPEQLSGLPVPLNLFRIMWLVPRRRRRRFAPSIDVKELVVWWLTALHGFVTHLLDVEFLSSLGVHCRERVDRKTS